MRSGKHVLTFAIEEVPVLCGNEKVCLCVTVHSCSSEGELDTYCSIGALSVSC